MWVRDGKVHGPIYDRRRDGERYSKSWAAYAFLRQKPIALIWQLHRAEDGWKGGTKERLKFVSEVQSGSFSFTRGSR